MMSAQVLHNINIDHDDGWPCLNKSLVLEIGLEFKNFETVRFGEKNIFTDGRQNCKV